MSAPSVPFCSNSAKQFLLLTPQVAPFAEGKFALTCAENRAGVSGGKENVYCAPQGRAYQEQ